MPEKKRKKKSKLPLQLKHPNEPCEVLRREIKYHGYLYKQTLDKPIMSNVLLLNVNKNIIINSTITSKLTQFHSLFLEIMIALGHKNRTVNPIPLDKIFSAETGTKSLLIINPIKEIKEIAPVKIQRYQQLTDFFRNLILGGTVNYTVTSPKTNELIISTTHPLVQTVGYLPKNLEQVKKIIFSGGSEAVNSKIINFILNIEQRDKQNPTVFKPKGSHIIYLILSPIFYMLFNASKIRINYSPEFLKKLYSISDGLLISIVKYITSQKAPYHVKLCNITKSIIKNDNEQIKDEEINMICASLRKKAVKNLKAFGIYYDKNNDMLFYLKNIKSIGFSVVENDEKIFKLTGGKDETG